LKAIDFVLAFPQAELDVDIWMYLPVGFQVDTEKSLNATSLSSTKAYKTNKIYWLCNNLKPVLSTGLVVFRQKML
jgi:hypothetical protein